MIRRKEKSANKGGSCRIEENIEEEKWKRKKGKRRKLKTKKNQNGRLRNRKE